MEKQEKIQFVLQTFETAYPRYRQGFLNPLKEDEFWLHTFGKAPNFENSLQLDGNLEMAYKAALNISRM